MKIDGTSMVLPENSCKFGLEGAAAPRPVPVEAALKPVALVLAGVDR
jgi:hypothetical protein